jgi:hypothetical protein
VDLIPEWARGTAIMFAGALAQIVVMKVQASPVFPREGNQGAMA